MTLFGLAGGLVAWVLGEGLQWSERAALRRALQREQEYRDAGLQGRLQVDTAVAAIKANTERWAWQSYRFSIGFCVLCGGILAGFLGVAEPFVERNWPMAAFRGALGILAGIVGGALVGSFIDALYRAVGGGKPDAGLLTQITARAIGWAILGLFLSISAGLILRNFKKLLCGLAGGLLGGLLGGCLFDPIGKLVMRATDSVTAAEVVGRLFGVVAIGALSGLATGLIENAVKTGCVRVIRGLIAGKQFILYRNPTCLGSSPQCEIYLFKDPGVAPRHSALHLVPGGFELEDLGSGLPTYVNGQPIRRRRLKNDDQIQVGSTVFLFQERRRQS
jgi:hypothetical protein